MGRLIPATMLLGLAATIHPVAAQSLRGSRASVEKQYGMAVSHDYSFLESTSQVKRFASRGLLVSLGGDANYELAGVSYPYARPAVKTFVERLARQYRAACGERLVVTSLTRPTARQPRNASDQSVHPAGMAADLRISRTAKCRVWLERVLLDLENKGVVEATRERFPAHYHIAVFPNPYLAYIGRLPAQKLAAAEADAVTVVAAADGQAADDAAVLAGTAADAGGAADDPDAGTGGSAAETEAGSAAETEAGPAGLEVSVYRVNRGDTLWSIARQHGLTVSELKALNGLRGSRIRAGQRLKVPAGAAPQAP